MDYYRLLITRKVTGVWTITVSVIIRIAVTCDKSDRYVHYYRLGTPENIKYLLAPVGNLPNYYFAYGSSVMSNYRLAFCSNGNNIASVTDRSS